MARKRSRLEREKKTLLAMLRMYCQEHHGSAGKQLYPDCQQLREYAEQRLQKCPFGVEKGIDALRGLSYACQKDAQRRTTVDGSGQKNGDND